MEEEEEGQQDNKMMELILQGIQKTQCLLDDIIVVGSSEEEHFHILEQVLERLERHNLAINMEKCAFPDKLGVLWTLHRCRWATYTVRHKQK